MYTSHQENWNRPWLPLQRVDQCKTRKSMESLIYVEMDLVMTWCLLWEILVFVSLWCFSIQLDSVICGKIEKTASITATPIIKTRTLSEIHTKVPKCSNNMCIVCVKKRVFSNMAVIVKRLQAHFPLFSTQQNIWSPWINTQGLSQCIWGIVHGQADKQKHSVTLFLASANTQHVTPSSLPCEHCWELRLIWVLKKMLKV